MKITSGFVLIIFLICLVNLPILGQEKINWIRVESENKEISFEMPQNYSYFFDKQGYTQSNPSDLFEKDELKNVRSISAYSDGAAVFFESYDVRNAKKTLPFMTNMHRSLKFQNLTFENLKGLHTVKNSKGYTTFFYFASEKNIYLFGVGARDKENETLKRFLNSLKLNGKPVFNSSAKETFAVEKTVSVEDLQETVVEVVKLSKEEAKAIEKKHKETEELKPKSDSSENMDEAEILFTKPVKYTNQASETREKGTILLNIELSAEGKVKKIKIVKGMGSGMTEEAIKTAKKIIFLPRMLNNEAVSTTKNVVYTFS